MKKISVLLALMLAMCSFTACGENNDSDEKDAKSSESEQIDDDDDDDDSKMSDKKDDSDDDDDSKKSDKKDDSDDDDDSKKSDKKDDSDDDDDSEKSGGFVRGEVNDGVYTNDFIGLTFEIPDGWEVLSYDEIKATMDVGLNAGGSDFEADALLNSTTYDLVARDAYKGESVMIIVEDLSKYPSNFTSEDFMKAAKISTEYTLPDVNIDWDLDGEKDTLCGIEFDVYSMEAEIEAYGISMTQEYHITEKDGYMIVVTYSGTSLSEYEDSYTDFFKD